VHLAQREIVELEGQARRDIGVGRLLMRQHDVQTDRFGAHFGGAAVGRFHDRGPAARADHELAHALFDDGGLAGDAGQLAGFLIVMRIGGQPFGGGLFLGRVGGLDAGLRLLGRGDAGRAIAHQGRADPGLFQQHFGLQQFKLEADRAQFLAQQEFGVAEGQLVGGALRLGGVVAMGLDEAGFLLGLVEAVVGYFFFFGHLLAFERSHSYRPKA
jgi:hypothetical protein